MKLPDEFVAGVRHLRDTDLLIVMGTSLTVHPFASLAEMVPEECARLLLNLDHVGGWGSRTNDVACLMPCDKAVQELCKLLGWEKELEALWEETNPSPRKIPAADEDRVDAKAEKTKENGEKEESEDKEGKETIDTDGKKVSEELLEDVVDKLAEIIGEVRLEDEGSSKTEERTEQHLTEGETASARGTSESVIPDESRESPSNPHHSEEGSSEGPSSANQSEPAPPSERNSDTSNLAETGKL